MFDKILFRIFVIGLVFSFKAVCMFIGIRICLMSLRDLTFYPLVLVTLALLGMGNFPGLLLELLSPGETCFLDNRTSGFPFSWFTSLALSLPEKVYKGHKVVGYLKDWIGLLSSN